MDELFGQNPERPLLGFWFVGLGYRAIGDYTRALDAWTRAVDRHEVYALTRMPIENRNHPVIGKHPRFLALLKRMGLESKQVAIEQPN